MGDRGQDKHVLGLIGSKETGMRNGRQGVDVGLVMVELLGLGKTLEGAIREIVMVDLEGIRWVESVWEMVELSDFNVGKFRVPVEADWATITGAGEGSSEIVGRIAGGEPGGGRSGGQIVVLELLAVIVGRVLV